MPLLVEGGERPSRVAPAFTALVLEGDLYDDHLHAPGLRGRLRVFDRFLDAGVEVGDLLTLAQEVRSPSGFSVKSTVSPATGDALCTTGVGVVSGEPGDELSVLPQAVGARAPPSARSMAATHSLGCLSCRSFTSAPFVRNPVIAAPKAREDRYES